MHRFLAPLLLPLALALVVALLLFTPEWDPELPRSASQEPVHQRPSTSEGPREDTLPATMRTPTKQGLRGQNDTRTLQLIPFGVVKGQILDLQGAPLDRVQVRPASMEELRIHLPRR